MKAEQRTNEKGTLGAGLYKLFGTRSSAPASGTRGSAPAGKYEDLSRWEVYKESSRPDHRHTKSSCGQRSAYPAELVTMACP